MILLNRDLITELDIIAVFNVITFREFSIENLQRVRQANRGRLFLRTSGLVPFGTCICSNVETIHSWTCHVHGPFEFRISIGSSILRTNLLPNRTLLPILTLLPNFGGFHRTLQRVRLANRGRLLLRTPGPAPFGTCICSNVEIILSWTCHVYGPFEFRTYLGTSILPYLQTKATPHIQVACIVYLFLIICWN